MPHSMSHHALHNSQNSWTKVSFARAQEILGMLFFSNMTFSPRWQRSVDPLIAKGTRKRFFLNKRVKACGRFPGSQCSFKNTPPLFDNFLFYNWRPLRRIFQNCAIFFEAQHLLFKLCKCVCLFDDILWLCVLLQTSWRKFTGHTNNLNMSLFQKTFREPVPLFS